MSRESEHNKANARTTSKGASAYLNLSLQKILQSVISFVGVVYATGFLVVNSNFSIYGITDYQLVQTRYVGAGLNYLFVHIGIAAMIAIIILLIPGKTKIVWVPIIALVLWALLAIPIYLNNQSVFATVVVGVNAGIIALVAYLIWAIWKEDPLKWIDEFLVSYEISMPAQFLAVFLSFCLIILVCISAMCWGWSFWPVTSSSLGGGRPNEAIFVFDAEKLPEEGLPFVQMQNDAVSEQIPLLFERSDEFTLLVDIPSTAPTTLRLSKFTAVRISKSIVLSAVFARSTPFSFGRKQAIPTLAPTVSLPKSPVMTPSPIGTTIP